MTNDRMERGKILYSSWYTVQLRMELGRARNARHIMSQRVSEARPWLSTTLSPAYRTAQPAENILLYPHGTGQSKITILPAHTLIDEGETE